MANLKIHSIKKNKNGTVTLLLTESKKKNPATRRGRKAKKSRLKEMIREAQKERAKKKNRKLR
jgi:hypothetical protein